MNKKKRYAVVDLEATSASATAAIIQVGIVIIEGGKIVETYETDVNPYEPLTEHITNLTGITDEQLAQAPDFAQVAGHIFNLIKDAIFVAHNVKFDANLLAEHLFLEGYELRSPLVDTVELSQIFYPMFEKYTLSYLSEMLGLGLQEAHTAIADAEATARLFLKLQEKMKSTPRLTMETLLQFKDSLLFETGLVLEDSFPDTPLLHDYDEMSGLLLKKRRELSSGYLPKENFAQIRDQLGLDNRAAQETFAEYLVSPNREAVHFVQAAAGIGKTYAYLVTLLTEHPDQQLLVSVPNKFLQNQLMSKEVAHLSEAFGLSAHSLKGVGNYLSLDKFRQTLMHLDDNHLTNRFKMQLLIWLLETDTGDLDEIKQKYRMQSYFDQISHDGELAFDTLFPLHDFWLRAYQDAYAAQLVITNHAYLLHRIVDDKEFIKGKQVLIDEAQLLLPVMEEVFQEELPLKELILEVMSQLEVADTVLERRLLEDTLYQLDQIDVSGSGQVVNDLVSQIRQNLAELPPGGLPQLRHLFKEFYDTYYVEEVEAYQHQRVSLRAASMAYLGARRFFPVDQEVTLVSATLEINATKHLGDLLGFETYSSLALPMEQSYQQHLWVDNSMPEPDEIFLYEEALVDRLMKLLPLERPILVLFTSKALMFAISERLEAMEIRHLTQDKNGLASNVKRRFDKGEVNLLLGTSSFWQGADFDRQEDLIMVITKLPFDNPQQFLVQKMTKELERQGLNAFRDFQLPIAILRLKQALGRSRRRPDQRSAVLVLDSRLAKKAYGKDIQKSLASEIGISLQKSDKIVSEIGHFLI